MGMVLIRHSDGREYAVTPADFARGAEETFKGFRIVSFEDGSTYDGPKTAAAVAKAQDKPAEKPQGEA